MKKKTNLQFIEELVYEYVEIKGINNRLSSTFALKLENYLRKYSNTKDPIIKSIITDLIEVQTEYKIYSCKKLISTMQTLGSYSNKNIKISK